MKLNPAEPLVLRKRQSGSRLEAVMPSDERELLRELVRTAKDAGSDTAYRLHERLVELDDTAAEYGDRAREWRVSVPIFPGFNHDHPSLAAAGWMNPAS